MTLPIQTVERPIFKSAIQAGVSAAADSLRPDDAATLLALADTAETTLVGSYEHSDPRFQCPMSQAFGTMGYGDFDRFPTLYFENTFDALMREALGAASEDIYIRVRIA